MGRSKILIDNELLLEKRSQKKSIKEISGDLGISTATLSRRIAELENEQGILTKYRELQHLQLTSLQFRVLHAITPEKIAEAKLTDLIACFNTLKKAELATQGKRELKVSGLLQYLVDLEECELMGNKCKDET